MPRSVSDAAYPSAWVVRLWSSAVTDPDAARSLPPPWALPTPVTLSPTCTLREVSKVAVVSPDAFCSCSTATSSAASVPTTVAVYVRPVDAISTVIFVAPSTTWLLVRISPMLVTTVPVPAASACP